MLKRYLALIVAALVILFTPLAVSSQLRDGALRLIRPIGRFFTERNAGLRNAWLNLMSIGTVREERSRLQQQVVALQQQVIATEDLRRENDALKQELGVTGVTRELPKLAARVVLQGANPLDYTMTVDVGRAQGVREGQPAVAQGALIGRVIEVREHSAVVRAITSLQSQVQAWLAPNQEKGFLIGTGNGVLLQDISQGLDVPEGTVVETSGLGGSLPQGILIGQVGQLESAKSELSQKFRITIPFDPTGVQNLFILLTEQP